MLLKFGLIFSLLINSVVSKISQDLNEASETRTREIAKGLREKRIFEAIGAALREKGKLAKGILNSVVGGVAEYAAAPITKDLTKKQDSIISDNIDKLVSIFSNCTMSQVTLTTHVAKEVVPATPSFLQCVRQVYKARAPPAALNKIAGSAKEFGYAFISAVKGNNSKLLNMLKDVLAIPQVHNCANVMHKAYKKSASLQEKVDEECK